MGNGREFLEGLPLFYLGISLSIALEGYNLLRTLISVKSKITPAAVITTAGVCLLFLFLIPNVLTYQNPIADEAVKFWVVHLWEVSFLPPRCFLLPLWSILSGPLQNRAFSFS